MVNRLTDTEDSLREGTRSRLCAGGTDRPLARGQGVVADRPGAAAWSVARASGPLGARRERAADRHPDRAQPAARNPVRRAGDGRGSGGAAGEPEGGGGAPSGGAAPVAVRGG